MKKRYAFSGFLFILLCLMLSGLTAQGAQDRVRLFRLRVRDGVQTQYVSFYETTVGTQRKIVTDLPEQTLLLDGKATKVSLKVLSRSAYFYQNYQDVKLPKSYRPGTSAKKKKIQLVCADGTVRTFKLKLLRAVKPSVSAIALESPQVVLPQGMLKAAVGISKGQSLTGKIQIKNSAGKVVYSQKVAISSLGQIQFYWDLTASKGNKAGYRAGETVEAGSYKLYCYVYYPDGAKTKKVTKKAAFTVEKEPEEPTGTTRFGSFNALNTWPWIVTITDDQAVDYLAEVVCQEILKPKMTEFQRIKAIHQFCVLHYTRRGGCNTSKGAAAYPEQIPVSTKAAKAAMKKYKQHMEVLKGQGKAVVDNASNVAVGSRHDQMKTAISKQTGDCLNMAFMMEAICRHAGLGCDILENGLPGSHPLHHFFVAVRVEGKWYICDPRIENARLVNNQMTWTHFLRGKKNLKKGGDDDVRYSSIKSRDKYLKTFALVTSEDYKWR